MVTLDVIVTDSLGISRQLTTWRREDLSGVDAAKQSTF